MSTVRIKLDLSVEEQHYHLSEIAEVLSDLANDLREAVTKYDTNIAYPYTITLTKPNSYGMNRGSAKIILVDE